MTLPTDYKARKALPICTGVMDYFPLALAEIAKLSKIGNDKHNPGMPLHWSKGKSTDHADCLVRHQLQRGTIDEDTVTEEFPDGLLHDVAVAWRALAQLQIAMEKLQAEQTDNEAAYDEAMARAKAKAEEPDPVLTKLADDFRQLFQAVPATTPGVGVTWALPQG